jgi:hypothetical protein
MAALDWSQCPAVETIPGKVSGAWVFRDTRMPVATVFENLEAGASIDRDHRMVRPDPRTSHVRAGLCRAQFRDPSAPLNANSL